MRYTKKQAGKWIAMKQGKVIASGKAFIPLQKKISTRKDAASVRYSLVPKGVVTGML